MSLSPTTQAWFLAFKEKKIFQFEYEQETTVLEAAGSYSGTRRQTRSSEILNAQAILFEASIA